MTRLISPSLLSGALILALPLALGACKQKDTSKEANASGEILPGSISDAMLPEDRVTSQPPLAPQTARPGKAAASAATADATTAPDESAPAVPAEPAAAQAPD